MPRKKPQPQDAPPQPQAHRVAFQVTGYLEASTLTALGDLLRSLDGWAASSPALGVKITTG